LIHGDDGMSLSGVSGGVE